MKNCPKSVLIYETIIQRHKVLYYNLLTSGKMNSHLADIAQQVQYLILRREKR